MRECATVPVREEDVNKVESTKTPVVEYNRLGRNGLFIISKSIILLLGIMFASSKEI